MATNYFLNQYFTTTLNVGGGIDASQTTGIIVQSVTGLDITKPGIACITYTDPINTSTAEWVTYTSIDGSNELQGVTRGAEGFGAKTHSNGAVIAFPVSESHINTLATALSIGGVATNGVTTTLDEDDMSSNSATALATQQSIKSYVDAQGGHPQVFIIAGTFPSAATTNLSKTWFAPFDLTLTRIDLYVCTAGSGTGSTVVDVNLNGTTVCASTKPTLTTTETSDLSITPSTTAVSAGDAITIDVDSVTATTAPSDGYVYIWYSKA